MVIKMLPKSLRDKRRHAKKSLAATKRIIKCMEANLESSNPESIELASAFFQILGHHLENGDLKPADVRLASLLRSKN